MLKQDMFRDRISRLFTDNSITEKLTRKFTVLFLNVFQTIKNSKTISTKFLANELICFKFSN